jgi:hypothetical protein
VETVRVAPGGALYQGMGVGPVDFSLDTITGTPMDNRLCGTHILCSSTLRVVRDGQEVRMSPLPLHANYASFVGGQRLPYIGDSSRRPQDFFAALAGYKDTSLHGVHQHTDTVVGVHALPRQNISMVGWGPDEGAVTQCTVVVS